MWPLESRRDVVRIGAHRVERWAWSPAGLVCLSGVELDEAVGIRHDDPARLAVALGRLIEQQRATPASDSALKPLDRADLVLESVWLPVMLIETGPLLWSRTQVEALLGHRLARLFDAPGKMVAGWELMVDHRAGDLQGLGYGLAPSVKAALNDVAPRAGVRWSSMQPAFAWGWQRLRRQRRLAASGGWWLWIEQDRTLVCRVEGQRVVAMNAGAVPLGDTVQINRLVDVEALRQGVVGEAGPTLVAGWQAAPAPSATPGCSWLTVGAAAGQPAADRQGQPAAIVSGSAA